ncbi:MAG: ferrous iron transport protein A [Nitrospirae bacterium]|nr:ferrous iron transport protein A [Magnetococcales bacterium]
MGFVKGAQVVAEQTAPLGDPRIYTIRGYQISLRREEAQRIHLRKEESGVIDEEIDQDSHARRLTELNRGEEGIIQGIRGDFKLKRRLAEMGFIAGVRVIAEQTAPMGDPRIYTIHGYQISLRRAEAHHVVLAVQLQETTS